MIEEKKKKLEEAKKKMEDAEKEADEAKDKVSCVHDVFISTCHVNVCRNAC